MRNPFTGVQGSSRLGHSRTTMSAFAPDDVDLVWRTRWCPGPQLGATRGPSQHCHRVSAAAVLGRRPTYRWVGPGWSCCSCCCRSMLAERKQEERSRRPSGVRGGSSAPSAWGRERRCARCGGARWGAGGSQGRGGSVAVVRPGAHVPSRRGGAAASAHYWRLAASGRRGGRKRYTAAYMYPVVNTSTRELSRGACASIQTISPRA
eukprot:COSAG01_NODE_3133_length_6533_cov_117.587842_1_plen_205_part_10